MIYCLKSQSLISLLVQRGGGSATSSGQVYNSQESSLIPGKLVQSVRRPWLLDTIQGYKIEFVDNPTQARQPRMGMSSPTEQALLQEEVGKILSKRAIVEVPAERAAPRSLLSPQEGQRHETSNQLERVEHLCSTPSLQDGGPTHTERPPEDRRLDDQGRSEGRILHDPDTQLRQISPLLPSPKSSLPIHMPTIRPVLCSLGLYEDPEASFDPAQRAGCQVSGIHRRCIGLSRDGG